MEVNYEVPGLEICDLLVLDSNPKDYYNQNNLFVQFDLGAVTINEAASLYTDAFQLAYQ